MEKKNRAIGANAKRGFPAFIAFTLGDDVIGRRLRARPWRLIQVHRPSPKVRAMEPLFWGKQPFIPGEVVQRVMTSSAWTGEYRVPLVTGAGALGAPILWA